MVLKLADEFSERSAEILGGSSAWQRIGLGLFGIGTLVAAVILFYSELLSAIAKAFGGPDCA